MVPIPLKISVCDALRLIKTNTRKAIREHFQFLNKIYLEVEGIWSTRYFVSTVKIIKEVT
ncbi:MAG: transposase [Actinobacteria bacterium]|nr:transposase [Actinomycetota bacterium]